MTFNRTIGVSPLITWASTVRGSWISFAICETRKRTTAITSCVNKKKRGADVDWSTHLFLDFFSSHARQHSKSTYAMTIYEHD